MFVKHCKVEVYLLELNLCENDNMDNVVTRHFSKADTIGEDSVDHQLPTHWETSVHLRSLNMFCAGKIIKKLQIPPHSRYYREGDEDAVQYPIREGDTALEQIHEQHLRAAEQARQHCTGCWSLPGAGNVELCYSNQLQITDRLLFLISFEEQHSILPVLAAHT